MMIALLAASPAQAAEHHGQVTFAGLPVPGAIVTATQGGKTSTAVTTQQGVYSFPALADGPCTIQVVMTGFAALKQEVTVAPDAPATQLELKLMSLEEMRAALKPAAGLIARTPTPVAQTAQGKPTPAKPAAATAPGAAAAAAAPPPPPPAQDELSARANDGLLINGSVNNAATSPFSQSPAFGNNRNGGRNLYNGGLSFILDDSALDAKTYSLSGINTPKPSFNNITLGASIGGPIRIPHLLRNGPNFFVGYQRMRSSTDTTQSALVPDLAERAGNFSQEVTTLGQPVQVFNPATGKPYTGEIVPISAQAQALLQYYPLPNISGNALYNYQVPIVSDAHSDALQTRLNKSIKNKDYVFGDFAFQSQRSSAPNLFGFLDTTNSLGINTGVNWSHRFNQRLSLNAGFRFSRQSTRVTPFWENRQNVSLNAGITGNDQDPADWGPPSLTFFNGVTGLSDGNSSFTRNRTDAVNYSMQWNRRGHNVTGGVDFRRQENNYLSQQNPRGNFQFTGAATQGTVNGVATGGSDVADFLIGVPDVSSIAYGNADKYLRQSVYDAYFTDDFRINSQWTVNAGLRWEYGAPITELKNRLVNLDIGKGFATETPVLATSPNGALTGQAYPNSLVRPDRLGIEPRISMAWRPIPGSSMVVRASYGVTDDSSVYQAMALSMAQQAPLSKSLSVANSAACPLTLANGFGGCSAITPDLFAVDPNFRVGYLQTWNLAVQHDLPGSLQMTVTYLGNKGTRGTQRFLPNTYPVGGVNPCPSCPSGYTYLTSGGNSERESGQLQLRRRLRNGFTGSLMYTYSKSIDDDSSLGGAGGVGPGLGAQSSSSNSIAQNWLNLKGERGLSTFDQRHLLNVGLQYTTGMGLGGHTLMTGWRAAAYKEWTVLTNITAGSGLPETPIYPVAVPGASCTGCIRPSYTGAAVYAAPAGLHINPAAFAAPAAGQWGNVGIGSITGPDQFSLNASVLRTFRLKDRFNLDARVDSTNTLNHVAFGSYVTTLGSSQFGTVTAPKGMRSLQTTLRLRF